MLIDYGTGDTCATVHVRHVTADRKRARSLHVGMPAHVYPVLTARSPTYARIGRYATVPARAGYTWAHPPTCAPYTVVRLLTSARAPVVIVHPFSAT